MSLRRLPSRLRLMLGFGATMVLLFGGVALLVHALVENSIDQSVDRLLSVRASDLSLLVRGARGLSVATTTDGAFAQVIDLRTGSVREATAGHRARLLTSAQLRAAAKHPLLIDYGPQSRLLTRRLGVQPPSVLVVGTSLAARDHSLTILSDVLFIVGPVLLLTTCLAGYVLAAGALRPVDRMQAQASRISGAPRGARLPVPETNDELHRLGETLNEMLGRVDAAMMREHAFVADVSHELRTPLAILKLELELASASDISQAELQQRVRSAAEEVERITRLAEDLITIVRAEQDQMPAELQQLDAADVLNEVTARFAAIASQQGRLVRAEPGGALPVYANAAWLQQALANVVTNAMRYGRGTVILSGRRCRGSVELHVVDEGPGFDPQFIERAFERFTRAGTSVDCSGAGLGLSIVRAVAEAHGGSAGAVNRSAGGADVWLSLPCAEIGK